MVEEGHFNESLLYECAGKFVYRNDVTRGCGYTHKWSNAQTITVEVKILNSSVNMTRNITICSHFAYISVHLLSFCLQMGMT